MPNDKPEAEVPVALLSQALLELRKARGNRGATRAAVIAYFKSGIAGGFQVGTLMQWLFFWPDKNESVFSQVGYSAKEVGDFMEILNEKHSAQELGLRDGQMPPDTGLEETAGTP